jgi:hypothetical protein
MSEQVLFQAGSIQITTRIARFGDISYQITNVGSVAVYLQRKLNPIAVLLFFTAIASGYIGLSVYPTGSQQSGIALAIAATFLILAAALQMLWPKREFTFILKTSSNDVQKLVSLDGEHLDSIKGALEAAFDAYS